MNKIHVKVGDIVMVISGNHRGAQGKVIRVLREKNQVFIEGVRMIKKHMKRSQERPQGAIIEQEGPLHVSNVKLVEKFKKSTEISKSKSKKSTKISKTNEPKKKLKVAKDSLSDQEE